MSTFKNTVTVAGRKIEYGVDDAGIFKAELAGEEYSSKTLDGLKGMLTRQLQKKPLKIKVLEVKQDWGEDELELAYGVITGVHSGTRNLLVRWDGEARTEQVHQYRGGVLKGDTDTRELKRIYRAYKDAKSAYERFKIDHGFDRSELDKMMEPEDK